METLDNILDDDVQLDGLDLDGEAGEEALYEPPKNAFPGEEQKGEEASSSGFKVVSGKENNYRVPTSRMRGKPGEGTTVELGDGELFDDEEEDQRSPVAAGADVLFDLPTLGNEDLMRRLLMSPTPSGAGTIQVRSRRAFC